MSTGKGAAKGNAETILYQTLITEEDLQKGKHHKHTNYQCTTSAAPDGDPYDLALRDGDYSYDTLKNMLKDAGFGRVKTTRDGVFAKGDDWANYHTVGLYTHGGTYGITNKTKEHTGLVRYLNAFGRHHLGGQATWTSITIALNASTAVHHDFHNRKGARNYTVTFGQSDGGGLWIEDRDVREGDVPDEVKWRQAGTGHWLPGRVVNTKEKFYEFDPFYKHGTEPWEGDRWCLTYHTTRNIVKAGKETKGYLKKCGFPLPSVNRVDASSERTRKPAKSIRKNIFNNAAKISVMMATLITAARSYMTTQVLPDVQPDPVVLFEIGGTKGTEEVTALGKDVFEPMSWERYRTPKGKLDAFHVVNGGSPRELRLHLDGKTSGCDEALAELISAAS